MHAWQTIFHAIPCIEDTALERADSNSNSGRFVTADFPRKMVIIARKICTKGRINLCMT